MEVRARFAPSPTGHLHIGGARTALFNWLFCRHESGKFLLRIEDTDPERSREEYTRAILDGLRWLGLDWDEDLIFQSQRVDKYRATIERMLKEGTAYYCSCTPEELDQMRENALKTGAKPKYDGRCRTRTHHPEGRPKVVRFACPPEGHTAVQDIIQGEVVFDNSELDDLVLMRSDGSFTYNFCAVVDDNDMRITHIIRGGDHLNNTPRQILLYQALGYELPRFAHHPLILGQDKSKLSKRHGATALIMYKDMGYLPEAMMNFLVRIGWSHGDQEVFSKEEMVKLFRLEDLTSAPGVWNPEKLLWINGHYIRSKPLPEIAELALPFFKDKGYAARLDDYFMAIIRDYQVRAKTLVEFAESAGYFYADEVVFDEKSKTKFLTKDTAGIIQEVREKIEGLEKFDKATLESLFGDIMKEKNLSMKTLAQPVRVAVTGSAASPGLFEVLETMGKERVIKRLERAIKISAGIE